MHSRAPSRVATMTNTDPIYLDHNATTPLLAEVVDAMLPYFREHFGNPSSSHPYGVRARQAVDQARAKVAALLGCEPSEVLFTSGGTEANNLAIRGVCEAWPERRGVVTSVIEHPATARPCTWLERRGQRVTRLGVDTRGRVSADHAGEAIDADTALVTVMHSNNETGVLQPIQALARLCHQAGALMHTDAAQSVGKLPVDVRQLGVDLLSVAGHKLYAPKGVGALYLRRGVRLSPLLLGAGHEAGRRPGTENVASIVGLGVACEVVGRDLLAAGVRMAQLRDLLWRRLESGIPGLLLNGDPLDRLPNTLNVRLPGASGSAVLAAAPEVAASTGSACHEGAESASPVIVAMGVGPVAALGSIRLTLGRGSTEDEALRAADCLVRAWREVIG